MKYNVLPTVFDEWIRKIAGTDEFFPDILYKLNDENIVKEWLSGIEGVKEKTSRILPFDKPLGWIKLPKNQKQEILAELQSLITEIIALKNYKFEGIINLMNLVNRIDLSDDEHFELLKNMANQLDEDTPDTIIKILIENLNKKLKFPDYNFTVLPKTVSAWENLFRQINYLDLFACSPIDILYELIVINKKKLSDIEIMSLASPFLRAILFEFYGLGFDEKTNSDEVLNFLRNGKIEPEFIVAVIFDKGKETEPSISWISDDIISWLLENRWYTAGRTVLQRTFGVYYGRLNDTLRDRFIKIVSNNLTNWFLTNKFKIKAKEIIKSMEWPDDFEAFAGWLNHMKKTGVQLKFKLWMITDFSEKYVEIINNFIKNIPEIVLEKRSNAEFWPLDIFHTQSQLAASYALYFLLSADLIMWNKWYSKLSDLVYQIRPLYYGSYSSIYIAKVFTEQLLIFTFSYVNIDDVTVKKKTEKIKQMLSLISNSLLYTFVRAAEREDIIWNPDGFKSEPYMPTKEMYLLNVYLIDILKNKIKTGISQDIINQWREFSSTDWPWMR